MKALIFSEQAMDSSDMRSRKQKTGLVVIFFLPDVKAIAYSYYSSVSALLTHFLSESSEYYNFTQSLHSVVQKTSAGQRQRTV